MRVQLRTLTGANSPSSFTSARWACSCLSASSEWAFAHLLKLEKRLLAAHHGDRAGPAARRDRGADVPHILVVRRPTGRVGANGQPQTGFIALDLGLAELGHVTAVLDVGLAFDRDVAGRICLRAPAVGFVVL